MFNIYIYIPAPSKRSLLEAFVDFKVAGGDLLAGPGIYIYIYTSSHVVRQGAYIMEVVGVPVSDPLDGTSDATPTCDSWYICIYISLYTRQFSVTAKRGGWILWIPKYPEVLPNPCPSGIQLYNGTHPPQSQLLRRYDSIPRDISFIYVYI